MKVKKRTMVGIWILSIGACNIYNWSAMQKMPSSPIEPYKKKSSVNQSLKNQLNDLSEKIVQKDSLVETLKLKLDKMKRKVKLVEELKTENSKWLQYIHEIEKDKYGLLEYAKGLQTECIIRDNMSKDYDKLIADTRILRLNLTNKVSSLKPTYQTTCTEHWKGTDELGKQFY